MSDYKFKAVKFDGIRKPCNSMISASVHKSQPHRLTIRFREDAIKRGKISAGQYYTPFVDLENRALLLLSSERPVPDEARKVLQTSGIARVIEFPRANEIAQLLPGVTSAMALDVRECIPGRILLVFPKPKTK
jgi:hypothetical protein